MCTLQVYVQVYTLCNAMTMPLIQESVLIRLLSLLVLARVHLGTIRLAAVSSAVSWTVI